jgi:hypothetical protein
MKKLTVVLSLWMVLAGTAIADQTGGPAPLFKDAVEGGTCKAEGTLNDMQAASPLICVNGAWRKVIFKHDDKGTTEPISYEGRCSLRFTDDKETKGKVTLKAGEIADICLPVGWRVILSATTNSSDWLYNNPATLANVVFIKSLRASAKSTLWIYPKTADGKASQKFEIELRSGK